MLLKSHRSRAGLAVLMSCCPLLVAAAASAAQVDTAAAGPRPPVAPAKEAPKPAPEMLSETHHTVTIGGRVVHYRALAGDLLVGGEAKEPRARMFYVAYLVEGGANIELHEYESGHMMYLHQPSLARLKADLAAFYAAAKAPAGPAGTTPRHP